MKVKCYTIYVKRGRPQERKNVSNTIMSYISKRGERDILTWCIVIKIELKHFYDVHIRIYFQL